MRILKILLIFIVMTLCGSLHAEKVTHLVFYFKDGATASIQLHKASGVGGHAVMKIGSETITVTVPSLSANMGPYTYEATDLDYFTFEEHEVSALPEVDAISKTCITAVGAGQIVVSGENCAEAGVYDLNGHRLNVPAVKGEGTLTLSLAELPAGVYIIACRTAQLKITKK